MENQPRAVFLLDSSILTHSKDTNPPNTPSKSPRKNVDAINRKNWDHSIHLMKLQFISILNILVKALTLSSKEETNSR
jgi:hypothetical protein